MKRCIDCDETFDAADWRCPACGFVPATVGEWPTFAPHRVDHGPEEFDATTFTRMAAFERRSFYTRSRLRLIQWALTAFFPNMGNFYDFGAGTGYILDGIRSRFPDIPLYGSDLSADGLPGVDAELGGAAELFHTDADHIPFAGHFDVIGAFDVLEHIDDDVAVLRAFYRALTPGGGVLLTVPQHMFLWSHLDVATGHKRRYEGDELAVKVRNAGFDVALDSSFMGLLLVPQYVSRRWLVGRAPDAGFEFEHMMTGPLNGLLEGVLSVELKMLQAGVRPPFGGLRIVAARKP